LSQTSILRNGDKDTRIKQTPKSGREVKCLREAATTLAEGQGETTKTEAH